MPVLRLTADCSLHELKEFGHATPKCPANSEPTFEFNIFHCKGSNIQQLHTSLCVAQKFSPRITFPYLSHSTPNHHPSRRIDVDARPGWRCASAIAYPGSTANHGCPTETRSAPSHPVERRVRTSVLGLFVDWEDSG